MPQLSVGNRRHELGDVPVADVGERQRHLRILRQDVPLDIRKRVRAVTAARARHGFRVVDELLKAIARGEARYRFLAFTRRSRIPFFGYEIAVHALCGAKVDDALTSLLLADLGNQTEGMFLAAVTIHPATLAAGIMAERKAR